MTKRPSHHFLHFTRKEKNGTVFLLFIILVLIGTPFFFSVFFKEKSINPVEFEKELAALKIKSTDSTKNIYAKIDDDVNYHPIDKNEYKYPETNRLFNFDPNTLPVEGWIKLGVKEKAANTIKNYLSKGGKFKQPDDLKKIWGLRPDLVERLLPYVIIAKSEEPARFENKNHQPYGEKKYEKKILQPFDINAVDTAAFIALPGIGSKLAQRIIGFRDKVGGFYAVSQVAETFGLPDSTFQKIKGYLKVSGENIKRININTALVNELSSHPYIRYQLGNAIVQYRSQHGNFSRIEGIKNIMMVTDEMFIKISPYLTVE